MSELWLREPQLWEPPVAFHLHPNYRSMEEMGHQLDSQAPSPLLWDEIYVANDLLLHSSRGVVRGCDHVTGIEVTGESLVAEFT